MTIRFPGLIPSLALPATMLLAMGVAQAQGVQSQTGSMAYPQSLPSGQVKIAAPTTRDTGNMAYPASQGGVTEASPTGADTGTMATPRGRASLNRGSPMMRMAAAPAGDPANAMRPDVAPTPAQTRAAESLDSAPAAAPVPYTDFLPPARMATGKAAMMRHGRMPVHHAVMRHMAKKAATPAAATAPAATPAPAAPAATPAAPAK